MKKIYIIITLSFIFNLISCASISNEKFQGQSFTFGGDNILRDDVVKNILSFERASNPPCNQIQTINSSIVDTGFKKNNLRTQVKEIWEVKACDKITKYKVILNESPEGGVDFIVGTVKN